MNLKHIQFLENMCIKRELWLMIFMMLMLSRAHATDVNGVISSDATWLLANSPYVVTSSIIVNTGVTLTIQPGVTVKFIDGLAGNA